MSEARAARTGGGLLENHAAPGREQEGEMVTGTERSKTPPHSPGALTLFILVELPLELVEVRHAYAAA